MENEWGKNGERMEQARMENEWRMNGERMEQAYLYTSLHLPDSHQGKDHI